MPPEKAVIKTTCPRDCYDACGITALVRDGAVRKVLGDRDHHVSRGALCSKCAVAYNGAFLDHEKRLQTPLRRAGRKGTATFEPVTWETALSDIAHRLKTILAERPSQSIFHTHYTGTVSMLAGWFPLRFFNRLGATEVDPDTVCNKAGHVVLADMFGTSLAGFDPEDLAATRCLLIWGANPSHSAPHMHADWIKSQSAKVIVIDPIAHKTARSADLHLQLRPGSDAALAFGLLYVLTHQGSIDEAFIRNHVEGFDAVRADIAAATPARTEDITGVPQRLIEEAALAFAAGPSMLWLGQGLQRQPLGGNAFRSAVLLNIATGNIGKSGAGFCYMNGPETRGVDMGFLAAPELRADGGASISHVRLAETLLDRERAAALFTWNNNIVASSPAQGLLKQALAREDLFTVVTDLFMTDTAAFADYVLPAASFLEFDDLIFPYFHHTVSAQVKAAAPLGQALPNQEIFRRLARSMGYEDSPLYESDAALIARLLGQTSFAGSFDDLKTVGTARLFATPRTQFADLKFATPTGKIEVTSARLAGLGHPLAPTPSADTMRQPGRLRVLSPASSWLMNSSYGNDDTVRARMGRQKAFLHAADMQRAGVTSGDVIVLKNETGALEVEAQESADVPPGVALVHKGTWPGLDPARANVNVLNGGLMTDIGESSAVHGVLAEVARS